MTTTTMKTSDGREFYVTSERHSYRTRIYARPVASQGGAYIGSLMRPATHENVIRMQQGKPRHYRAGYADGHKGVSWESPTLIASPAKAKAWLLEKALAEGVL